MNLDFRSIKRLRLDKKPYLLQVADVTDSGEFWRAWKYAKSQERQAALLNAEIDDRSITSVCMLARAINGSRQVRTLAYRLYPDEPGQPFGKFELSYRMRDTSKLLPYQVKPAQYLCNSLIGNGAACDGSDTGLGKTFHALAAARDLYLQPAIICRMAGIANWQRIARYFGIKPLFVINWESAKSPKFKYVRVFQSSITGRRVYKWELPPNVLLIFDEAHMGSNEDSQNHALWIASKGRASLSLSATFADRPSRLKGLFSVLGVMEPAQFSQWLREHAHFTNRYNDLESSDAMSDLKGAHKMLYPRYGCRVSYDDESVKAYVKQAVIQTEIVNLGAKLEAEQNRDYETMLRRVEHYKALGQQAEAMTADLRYRQSTELRKVKLLADLAKNYIEQGLAVIIFVNFRETLRYLAELLRTKSLIFGDQRKYGIDREAVIDAFQCGRTHLVLSMVSAGGQSINLHDVNGTRRRLSLVAPTYNPIDLVQVLGRTYRSGSKSVPIIKLVYAVNTVEEKIAERVNEKINNIKALNDGDLMEPDLFKLGLHRKERDRGTY